MGKEQDDDSIWDDAISFLAKIVDAFSTALFENFADFFLLNPLSVTSTTRIITEVIVDVLQGKTGLSKQEQDDIRRRAMQASQYLANAGAILSDLQGELEQRNLELERLLDEINSKRDEAEHWEEIAKTNEKLASALTTEIERRVRTQIRAELDRNKTRRQIVGVVIWVFTLLAGAIAGAIVQQWWQAHGFSLF